MVYDIDYTRTPEDTERGFTIHDNGKQADAVTLRYELYTDDGLGNGNHIVSPDDIYWIRRIAYSLDMYAAEFDYNGYPKL